MATAEVLLPYAHTHYDTLPSLHEASEHFQRVPKVREVIAKIGEVLVKHRAQDLFGVILLHSHVEMEPKERMVHFGNVAVPWEVPVGRNGGDGGGGAGEGAGEEERLAPCAWRFVPEGIAPYEFVYVPPSAPAAAAPSAPPSAPPRGPLPSLSSEHFSPLRSELAACLSRHGVQDLFGVCALEGGARGDARQGFEFTAERANITLDVNIYRSPGEGGGADNTVEAVWQAKEGESGLPGAIETRFICIRSCLSVRNGREHVEKHSKKRRSSFSEEGGLVGR